jgi:hypothetical protein
MSKDVLKIILLLLFSFLLILLIPISDQPDFLYRANRLINQPIFPFNLFNFSTTILKPCPEYLLASPFSLWVDLEYNCLNNLILSLKRFVVLFVLILPILFLVLTRHFNGLGRQVVGNSIIRRHRLEIVFISIMLPGMIYYLSVFSYESVVLLLFLIGWIYLDSAFILFIIILLSSLIDLGNTLVFTFFVLLFHLLRISQRRKQKSLFYLIILSIIILPLLFKGILHILEYIPGALGYKASSILKLYSKGVIEETSSKYFILLRPIVSVASFFLYTPKYLKIPLAFIIGLVAYLISIYQILKNQNWRDLRFTYFISATAILYIFPLAIPAYSNGKYYVFLIPSLLFVYYKKKEKIGLFRFVAILTFITLISISVFYVI